MPPPGITLITDLYPEPVALQYAALLYGVTSHLPQLLEAPVGAQDRCLVLARQQCVITAIILLVLTMSGEAILQILCFIIAGLLRKGMYQYLNFL